jgi:hypothetical protein
VKIPDPKDPHGDLEGSVLRSDVLEVLVRHKVAISPQHSDLVDLERDDVVQSIVMPEIVRGLEVRHISRILGIELAEFYAARRHVH